MAIGRCYIDFWKQTKNLSSCRRKSVFLRRQEEESYTGIRDFFFFFQSTDRHRMISLRRLGHSGQD